MTDPRLGTFIQRYRLTRRLGTGGMGSVYLGIHPEIGSRVAIKILAPELALDNQMIDRFFAEARAVNLIRHEHIVNVLDLARIPNGEPYIMMEYVAGKTLRQVAAEPPVALGGLIQVINDVLLALHAAHEVGIIHRDIKPDNVLVTASGRAKVLDFGIAKLASGLGPRTRTGAAMGTAEYMAPEQIEGAPLDRRTDIYAVGVTLFELATGQRPFDAATDFELMRQHLEDPPPDPRALRPDIPDALADVIRSALAKQPADRFVTARAMARALRTAGDAVGPAERHSLSDAGWLIPNAASSISRPVVIDEPIPPPPVAPPPRRDRRRLVAIALIVLAIAVAIMLAR